MIDLTTYPLYPFEMITQNECIFCDRAKALLKSKGVAFNECSIDDPQLGSLWRAKLRASGLKTVPQIFMYNQDTQEYDLIGGFTDLERYFNG